MQKEANGDKNKVQNKTLLNNPEGYTLEGSQRKQPSPFRENAQNPKSVIQAESKTRKFRLESMCTQRRR